MNGIQRNSKRMNGQRVVQAEGDKSNPNTERGRHPLAWYAVRLVLKLPENLYVHSMGMNC